MEQVGVSFEKNELTEIEDFAKSNRLSKSSAIRMLSMEAIELRRPKK